ncbi:glycosyltransferase [bacterium]|nr:glycosyltransferase [bacterium]
MISVCAIIYLYCFIVVLFLIVSLWNSLGYKNIKPIEYNGENNCRISVIVPTRNEIANIKDCIDSLLNQDYPDYEILVVDGNSTDGTREIIKKYSKKNPKVKLVEETALPEGWVGKNFACSLGAEQASGDWLFFIDADTVHNKHMLTSVINDIYNSNVDFFSLMTGQKLGSPWENIILPNIFLWFGTKFPIRRVNSLKSKAARATGQFIAVRKDVYEATGGHAVIKRHIVEDFAFAKLVKQAGYRIKIAGGRLLVITRMYRNFKNIWDGFAKNVFFAAGGNLGSTVWAVVYVLSTQVLPFVAPFLLFFIDDYSLKIVTAAFFPLVMAFAIRLQLNFLLKLSHRYIFTIPLGGIITVFIHLYSAYKYLSGKGMSWKGRIYRFVGKNV